MQECKKQWSKCNLFRNNIPKDTSVNDLALFFSNQIFRKEKKKSHNIKQLI